MSALAKKKEQLNGLLLEVSKGQEKLDAAAKDASIKIEQAEIDGIHGKAKEALAIQEEVDRLSLVDRLVAKSREVANPRAPGEPGDKKETGKVIRMSAGRAFVRTKQYREARKNRQPGTWSEVVEFKGSHRDGIVALTPDEVKDFDPEDTPLSVIGSETLIRTERDSELVRFEEPRVPSLRDLLNVSATTSNNIEWLRLNAVNRGAGIVAPTAVKPYMNVTFTKTNTGVKTLAVLHKITEQQMEDAPQLANIVDTEMRADLRLLEEEQLLWGDGEGDNFSGLFTDQGVAAFARAAGGDTLIDTIRRMRTDIRLRRLTPSGVLVHPLDWEAVELAKGNDERYVWAVIQTPLGPRIWGMPVVESESAQNPLTGARLVAVADWARGATIWDRHEIRAMVGFVDDDFARNLRTMRAESRLAFGVKRPHAFVYHETDDGASS